ncbi:hypothetical protein [Streptomyces sp. NPDC058620]|uniref:hypothetical protein n=1 Tax=Streptomyces sp. NPDC058620 TaxID=3346560 RepID=UPI003654C23C
MNQRSQQAIDEEQPVLRAGTDRPPTRPGKEFGIPPGLPHQPQLHHRISKHGRRKRMLRHDQPASRSPHHEQLNDHARPESRQPCTRSSSVALVPCSVSNEGMESEQRKTRRGYADQARDGGASAAERLACLLGGTLTRQYGLEMLGVGELLPGVEVHQLPVFSGGEVRHAVGEGLRCLPGPGALRL